MAQDDSNLKYSTLEKLIRDLTQAINGQYPRPWMADVTNPERARIFIVGNNQATKFPVDWVGNYDRHIDALFNRNGQSCRALYYEMRGNKGPSRTRGNIDLLRGALTDVGIKDVLETNVICYSTPRIKDLKLSEHRGGEERGKEIFLELLRIIRPEILIAYGAGARNELQGLFHGDIPPAPSNETSEVLWARVRSKMEGTLYEPTIFPIQSLSSAKWNSWKNWAPGYFQNLATECATLLDVKR